MPVFRGPLPGQKKIPESLLHQFPESGFPENDIVNFQERCFNRIGGQILAGGKKQFSGNQQVGTLIAEKSGASLYNQRDLVKVANVALLLRTGIVVDLVLEVQDGNVTERINIQTPIIGKQILGLQHGLFPTVSSDGIFRERIRSIPASYSRPDNDDKAKQPLNGTFSEIPKQEQTEQRRQSLCKENTEILHHRNPRKKPDNQRDGDRKFYASQKKCADRTRNCIVILLIASHFHSFFVPYNLTL